MYNTTDVKIAQLVPQSTNCKSDKFYPIPPRTNRHGVLYQLHLLPPLSILACLLLADLTPSPQPSSASAVLIPTMGYSYRMSTHYQCF